MNINVVFEKMDAERDLPPERNVGSVNIRTNFNFQKPERNDERNMRIRFSANVNYNPGVGHINVRGAAYIKGEEKELSSLKEGEGKQFKSFVDHVSKTSMAQIVKLAEQVGIPLPLPSIDVGSNTQRDRETERMFG